MYNRNQPLYSRQVGNPLAPSRIGLNVHNFQDTTVDIVFLILTTTFVGLRFYARKLQNVRYGLEDWTIFAALMFFYIYIAASFGAIFGGGIGYHADQLTPAQLKLSLQIILAIQFLYAIGQGLVKCSICLLLMRLFFTRKFRIAARVVMCLCILWVIMTILIAFLICHPVDYNWNLKPIEGHCGNQNFAFGSVGVVDILTDTCILILPIPMIWNLQMPRSSRFFLGGLLGFGVFTISVTIVRVIVIAKTDFADFSYSSKGIFIWTVVNFGTGILVACCPLLRPIIEKLSPIPLFQSMSWSSSKTGTPATNASSRKHFDFNRLDEEGVPLHDMRISKNVAGGRADVGLPQRQEDFSSGSAAYDNTVYVGSNDPYVKNEGINVKTELRIDRE